MLSPVHLVLPVVGGHYLAQHQGADVDHAHDPRKSHELVHQRVQFSFADLDKGGYDERKQNTNTLYPVLKKKPIRDEVNKAAKNNDSGQYINDFFL